MLDGGAGIDTADYSDKTKPVVVTLNGAIDATVSVGGIAEDTIRNFENVTGGSGRDTLVGDGLDNVLNGGPDADAMRGMAGNDTYIVGNAGDVVDESVAGSNGIDTVQSSVNFSLSYVTLAKGMIENLTLTGAAAINGTGNAAANLILGNEGMNRIDGKAGNDTLRGNGGADLFVFDTALNTTTNRDHIQDFVHAQDEIVLDHSFFSAIPVSGTMSAAYFRTTAPSPTDHHACIIYAPATGLLTYDSNGGAAGGAVQFAVLDNHPTLTASDFIVVA